MTLSIGQVILSVSMMSVIILRVIAPGVSIVCQFAEWHYVDLHYADWYYAEWHYAE